MRPPIPGMPMPPEPSKKPAKKKPAKKAKPACRCEATPAAKKAAAAKKTAKKVTRRTPRATRTIGKTLRGRAGLSVPAAKKAAHHKATPAKKAITKAVAAATAKHSRAETHCTCKKTTAPRPRPHLPRH